jgi:hypothetical protein
VVPAPSAPPAAPAPSPLLRVTPAAPEVPCEVTAEEVRFRFGDRRYRVRGLARNTSYDALKVNLLAACGERFHVDTLDVYAARQRGIYVKQAASELGVEEDVVKADVGRVLLKLEQLQDQQIQEAPSGRRRWRCSRRRTSSIASSRISAAAAWSARRRTSS